jgi:hypothetical protein
MRAQIKHWASEKALNGQELLQRLRAQFGIEVHVMTIRRACARLGLVSDIPLPSRFNLKSDNRNKNTSTQAR